MSYIYGALCLKTPANLTSWAAPHLPRALHLAVAVLQNALPGQWSRPYKIWLVVYLPLWKIWKSIGIIIPNIWKNKIHVPNHQPEMVGKLSTTPGSSDSAVEIREN
jgi:hypothetical protein